MFKHKKLISAILAVAMLGAMSTSVFASEVEKVPAVPEATNSFEVAPRSFDKTYTKAINSSSYTKVGWDINHYDKDDTLRFSVSDDGSAEPQGIEFKLEYGGETEYYTLYEGEEQTVDIGPGVGFDLHAKYVSSGETGTIKGSISLQQD